MLKFAVRLATPLAGLAAGYTMFPREWRKSASRDTRLTTFNTAVLQQLEATAEFERLAAAPQVQRISHSANFPSQHHTNYVGSGLLFGPDLMEIDPVLFANASAGEITSFYHLGSKLASSDGQIHNGIVATILDEGLCMCGFPRLPSKKGVTAKLAIHFDNQAPPNSTVVLRAKVTEAKGRKVTIDGRLETFPLDGSPPLPIATSQSILVEPKWFKYLAWLQIF
ncbi:Thioesterase domain-containing protein [[Candida] zeylanoides]